MIIVMMITIRLNCLLVFKLNHDDDYAGDGDDDGDVDIKVVVLVVWYFVPTTSCCPAVT